MSHRYRYTVEVIYEGVLDLDDDVLYAYAEAQDGALADLAIDAALTGDAVYRTIGNFEVKRIP